MKCLALYLTTITLSLFAAIAFAQEKDGWSRIKAGSSDRSGGSLEAHGDLLCYIKANAWTQYDSVDLRTGTNTIQLNVANGDGDSAIQVWVGSTKVGTLTVGNTGGWNTYQSKSLTLSTSQSGVQDVKLVFVNGNVNVDWFTFSATTQPTRTPAARRPVAPAARAKWRTGTAALLKPRVVVLTDISTWETDDHESLIRFLAHADMFEIEGLIISTGYSIKTLTKSPEKEFIDIARGVVDAYEKDLPNLMKRSNQVGHEFDGAKQVIGYWPSPKYLKDRTLFGSLNRGKKYIGDDNDSPGSDLIAKLGDEEDPRPLWVTVWGGGNTVAQSIYRVKKDRTVEQFRDFLRRIRVYTITDQDRHYRGEGLDVSAHGWMREQTGSDLLFIWDESAWKAHNGTGRSNWNQYATHIQGHGNLGSQYPKYKYGVEGDTPSFLYLMPTGLNDPEDPTQCSWGGTFRGNANNLWQPSSSCRPFFDRFYTAAFNNFAARMDWAKEGAGNRNPIIVLDGDDGISVLRKTPKQGTAVTLDASKTHDPDGDDLKFAWWVQPDAGDYLGKIDISNSKSSIATVNVPSGSSGQSFHVICEVIDDGTHNLSDYRRIIFEPISGLAAEANQSASDSERLRVIMSTDFPPIGVVKGGNAPNTQKSDPDDMQSMVRFLLYANEFDIEGLIASAGTFAMEAHKKNILDVIDQYEKVYDNLRKHDPNYPTAEHLRSVTFEGKGNNHGVNIKWGRNKQPYTDIIGKGMDSEASNAIIAAADKPDPRPIWIGVWGGPREVAQAIWDVRNTRSEEELKAFVSKLRVFLIAYQDATHGWLVGEFPDLFLIDSRKTYQGMFGGHDPISDLAWVNKNIRNNHGPLCDVYPHEGMGCTGVCEGDSPTFLYLVSANRRINDPEDPTQESWGGQFRKDGDKNHYIDGPGRSSISKWREDYQKEFAERADWCVD